MLFNNHVLSAPAKILIIPFENASSDSKNDTLETGIPEILSVCFSSSPDQIVILDRTSLDTSLTEQLLSWEKYIAQNSIQSIGQIMAANFILRGSIVLEDDKIKIQALLFNVATTQLRHAISGTIELNDVVNSLCKNIAQPLVASLMEKTAQRTKKFQVEDMPEKQQLLINGLNHYYNGEFAQSFAPLLKLVKTYPDDASSHYWLAQSFYQAGLDDFAIIQFQDFITRFQNNSRLLKVKTQLLDLESKKLAMEYSNENK